MTSPLAGTQPLHDRVREAIAAQITSGAIPPGTRLQSERDLADRMGVSRVTVRRALDALAGDGLVRAARGSGRFVSLPALVEPSNVLLSFTELGAERGLQATSRVLRSRVRPATLAEAEVLTVAPGRISSSSTACGCSTGWRSPSTTPASRSRSPRNSRQSTSRRRRCMPRWRRPASGSCAPIRHRGGRRRCDPGPEARRRPGEPAAPGDDDGLRRVRPGRRTGRDRLPLRPLSLPCDTRAQAATRRRNDHMKRSRTPDRSARAALTFMAMFVVVLAALAGQATGARTATTLSVQDGEGGNTARVAALKQLDALFEKANPGVTIKHVSKSYDDLVKIDALQLSVIHPTSPTSTRASAISVSSSRRTSSRRSTPTPPNGAGASGSPPPCSRSTDGRPPPARSEVASCTGSPRPVTGSASSTTRPS